MKKSELTQLTQIIEQLVAKEVRKQLPKLIGEVFSNMAGKTVVTENTRKDYIAKEVNPPTIESQDDFKMSMKELFAGVTPTGIRENVRSQTNVPVEIKHYAKDPKLNAILNETVSDLRQRERMVGAAAYQGGYSPALAMVPGFNPSATGAGAMMSPEEEPSFARNMPVMSGPSQGSIPIGRPPMLMEGQESNHVPLEAIPEGISALDVARQVPLAAPVAQALTKNYSQMMKLIDSKRKR